VDNQIEFLLWLMTTTQLSQADLARKLGISASLMSRLLRGERRLTLPLLRHIAEVFDMPQAEVFARAGALDEPVVCDQGALQWKARDTAGDDVEQLRMQLSALRDLRTALAWSLEGKASPQMIEKLARLVELELEYNKTIREG